MQVPGGTGGRITEYGLALPAGWHLLPVGPASSSWASELAEDVVEGAEVAEAMRAAFAAQLEEVKAAVDATGVRGARTAVRVPVPAEPVVQAMLTLALGRDLGVDGYEEQLGHVVEADPSAQIMGSQRVVAEIPAGSVRGAHFLIGHLPDDADEAGVHLEERVHLGVFPPGSPDMVDVTAIAASIGAFDDLPAFVVGLLDDLRVSTEVPA